jgi:predicted nucleic acid-binding protein
VIVVDTSVLVPILRSAPAAETAVLWQLIDADLVNVPIVVRQEVRAGLSRASRQRVLELFGALPLSVPTESTWKRVEAWTDEAANAGERFALADMTIAALADELGALVWTLDRDFERMEKLRFVQLYVWRPGLGPVRPTPLPAR